ncbi:hypothetical protein T07_14167 [Trichinella nelsoni]|uniref:Uncharacterized protein n=1 Tax=Trichinella nelsoni TaxID=6336 RepID=A0A0V0RVM9_9BILA|nr:hypothetical protein T07_14167 [Trichinella nelsoni]
MRKCSAEICKCACGWSINDNFSEKYLFISDLLNKKAQAESKRISFHMNDKLHIFLKNTRCYAQQSLV